MYPFKVYNSMVFRRSMELCNHRHSQIPEHFIIPKRHLLCIRCPSPASPPHSLPNHSSPVFTDVSIPTFILGKACGNTLCCLWGCQSLPSDSRGKINDFWSITVGSNLSLKKERKRKFKIEFIFKTSQTIILKQCFLVQLDFTGNIPLVITIN